MGGAEFVFEYHASSDAAAANVGRYSGIVARVSHDSPTSVSNRASAK